MIAMKLIQKMLNNKISKGSFLLNYTSSKQYQPCHQKMIEQKKIKGCINQYFKTILVIILNKKMTDKISILS